MNGCEKKYKSKLSPIVVISYKCFLSIVFYIKLTIDDFLKVTNKYIT